MMRSGLDGHKNYVIAVLSGFQKQTLNQYTNVVNLKLKHCTSLRNEQVLRSTASTVRQTCYLLFMDNKSVV